MLTSRRATLEDHAMLMPRIAAFYAIEGITVHEDGVAIGLTRLLEDEGLGVVMLFAEGDGTPVGYATVTWGFDLEYSGRDGYLTDLYLDPSARGRGLGRAAVAEVERVAASYGVKQLHLMVRPQNHPALRLYVTSGYSRPPRLFFTKPIA